MASSWTKVEATYYNLPGDKVTGKNKDYAESLLKLATRLDLPDSYLDEIRLDVQVGERKKF